ncbi:MAG: hypothetical protein A7315_03660 [Candidatus Altiarchaeales archaeon WOR_SM1_79]|nr:MAG: hypothetical protein A7315_03660 [Candidatus Altiarchaeales archaeon WOR_SM1_79]
MLVGFYKRREYVKSDARKELFMIRRKLTIYMIISKPIIGISHVKSPKNTMFIYYLRKAYNNTCNLGSHPI